MNCDKLAELIEAADNPEAKAALQSVHDRFCRVTANSGGGGTGGDPTPPPKPPVKP